MVNNPNHEKSDLSHTAQASGAARGAIKAGKAISGSAKGAAFGPYGLAAGFAVENRKFLFEVLTVFLCVL